jgi:predicted phage baseplate assembly protein
MTLPVPTLDDRQFQDIVDEAKRLIGRHCPEWTNHNLSDPGVALIELFAWMTELTLYRINQVPERLYTKFLELMGIRLFGATPAITELTFWLTAADADAITVPAGTQVATGTSDVGEPVVFMTDEDLSISQPRLVACLSSSEDHGYKDCWEDLQYKRSFVTCFTSKPLQPGDCFYLGFAKSLAGHIVRLHIDADDIQGIGVDPDNPPLQWEVWSGEEWIAATVRNDTTGGLNRDGPLDLFVPRVHVPLALGDHTAYWLRVRLLLPVPGQPPYTTSPRISALRVSVRGGTVAAHHGQPVPAEHVGRSDGTPDQVFTLRHVPVLPRIDGELLRVITNDGATDWAEVDDFGRSGPDDTHYTLDPTSGEIRFGPSIRYADGSVRQHGGIPPSGSELVMLGYRYGGGQRGNVPARSLTVLRTTIPYIERVENLDIATGGVDAESVDNAKQRGPLTLRSGERAVTASDYEHQALQAAPSVARARCLPPAEPGGPVRLLVVPRVQRAADALVLDDFALSDELVEDIRTHLDERRVLGVSVEVGTPYYQGVTVAALVKGVPGRSPEAVRQRALDCLYKLVNPLTGGPQGTGWPFDTDLNASSVVQHLEALDGVERVAEVVLFQADVRNRQRQGRGKEVIRLSADSLFLSFNHRVVVR